MADEERCDRVVRLDVVIEDATLEEARFIFMGLEGNNLQVEVAGETYELSVKGRPLKSLDGWVS